MSIGLNNTMVSKEQNDNKCHQDGYSDHPKGCLCWSLKPIEIASNTVDFKAECTLVAVLRKISFLPSEALERIYFTMIVPKLTYGLLVQGTCAKNLLKNIECQHIKAARTVMKANEKVRDEGVLQRASWNNIEYI